MRLIMPTRCPFWKLDAPAAAIPCMILIIQMLTSMATTEPFSYRSSI